MKIEVQSKSHSYVVELAPDLATAVQAATDSPAPVLLVDRRVQTLYPQVFCEAQAQGRVLSVTASEEQKTYENLLPLFLALLDKGVRRGTTLCVVGGGVVQDIGCFIASVLFRGLRWELVPTTLLSQCDSCIGSKSSLNIGPYKNQLGTFYSPHRIWLAPSVLRTLTRDEIRSGLGEAIKLHLIAGTKPFTTLRAQLAALPDDPAELESVIVSSLLIKKTFIERDEFDLGIRNLLNYGHTFGHAFESTTQYAIPHGIAVTLGLSAATYISARLGWVTAEYAATLDGFLRPFYVPYEQHLQRMDQVALQAALSRDKKNAGTGLTCVLTRGEGRMEKHVLGLSEQAMPFLLDWLRTKRD
jgi:3-dehydroquinate synthase